MLIRITGAKEGIVEYLRTGRKQGRKESRGQLDERVTLGGDLDLVDQVLKSQGGEGEKYLHITLSFSEPDLPLEVYQKVFQDFRAFYGAAFREGEFMLYGEAHLPRKQTLTHARTGEAIPRLGHIHCVGPKINLFSGKGLNPFGWVEDNIRFIDAFQEWANLKYGLSSPKDHRRLQLVDRAELLSRFKGDLFNGKACELKKRVLVDILQKEILTFEGLSKHLSTLGEVRVRNAGTPEAYLNLKLPGEPKGINFKEPQFRAEFLALTTLAKQTSVLQGERVSLEDLEAILLDWRNRRSKEVKYLNSGNKSLWKRYHEASPEEKTVLLKELEQRFYERYVLESGNGLSLPMATGPVQGSTKMQSYGPCSRETVVGQGMAEQLSQRVGNAARSCWEQKPLRHLAELHRYVEQAAGLRDPNQLREWQEVRTPAQAWTFLREQLHWHPHRIWRTLRRFADSETERPEPSLREAWQSQRALERERRAEIRAAYLAEKKALFEKSQMPVAQRRAQYKVLQMRFGLAYQSLWVEIEEERLTLRRSIQVWIGSLEAASQPGPRSKNPLVLPPEWEPVLTGKGTIEYWKDNCLLLSDQGRQVCVHDSKDASTLETALRLAMIKFGPRLTVSGSDDFVKRIEATATRLRFNVGINGKEFRGRGF